MPKEDKKELWVGWTQDALGNYVPADTGDTDDIVDDMVEASTKYADSMLDEYEKRFGSGGSTRRRGKRKSALDDDPEDD